MANIRDKTAQIRQAVYGKDVRENIASGIEAISDQQDSYEQNLTDRQNDYETIVNNEWNNYKTNMDAAEQTREVNEDIRQSNEQIRQDTFNNNETTRQNTFNQNETTRQANEVTRQEVYTEFRDFVNTAQQINRVPYLFDGGDFGDTSSAVLTIDGGDF